MINSNNTHLQPTVNNNLISVSDFIKCIFSSMHVCISILQSSDKLLGGSIMHSKDCSLKWKRN